MLIYKLHVVVPKWWQWY